MKRHAIFLVLLLCAAAVLTACSSVSKAAPPEPGPAGLAAKLPGSAITAEGSLVPIRTADLSFAGGGLVLEVLADDGQSVAAGQVLARLQGVEHLEAEAAAARLEALQAEQALQKLKDDTFLALAQAPLELEAAQKEYDSAANAWNGKSGAAPTAFDTALKDYIDAEKDVRTAQRKLNDETDLAEDAPARAQAQDRLEREKARRAKAYELLQARYERPQEGSENNDRQELVKAVARLEAARLRLDKLNGGPDPDQYALLQARLGSARAAQAAAQEGLLALEIRAPWNGVLVNWDLKPGEVVAPAQVAGALVDPSGWTVETTDLTENSIVSVASGNRANITVNALPGETFTGVVESIHGKGEKLQGDITYKVHIAMDQADPRWYWKMTVKVTIAG